MDAFASLEVGLTEIGCEDVNWYSDESLSYITKRISL
jgi:hypothetical protein